ncbi:MAG: hypothetical protein JWN86_2171 [Planctomycetota bacterium]|nr:hypothetical protein [Planctomycetota bacterium]
MRPSLGILVLIVLFLLPMALIALSRHRARHRGFRPPLGTILAVGVPAVMFLLFFTEPPAEVAMLLLAASSVVFAWLWGREFINLMGLADEAFPGRYDKILWFTLMILLPPVGLLAFGAFRRVYWPAEKPASDRMSHELI